MKKLIVIQNLIVYITFFTEFLPLIFCILFYKKLNTKALKVFFIYAIVLSVSVFLGILALYVFHSKPYYFIIVKLYNASEYCLFAIFLFYLLNNVIVKRVIIFSVIPFLLISTISAFLSSKSGFSNYPSLIEFLAFIIFIIYFFYEKMNTVVEYPLYQSISFWVCVGLFIYFTGNFFFFLFITSSKDKQFIEQMRIIYGIVTICKNIVLCIALLSTERVESQDDILHIPSDLDLDSFQPKTSLN